MLSLENGGVAPPQTKAPLLGESPVIKTSADERPAPPSGSPHTTRTIITTNHTTLMTLCLCSLFEGTVEPLPDVLRLRDELARREGEVRAALAELEAPVIDNDNDNDERTAPASTAAASTSAASYAPADAAASPDSEPAAPGKKGRMEQSLPQHGPSWLVTLLTQHANCASIVLDFLGGGGALRGIGTTAPALRAEAKASLSRLKLRVDAGNGFFPTVAWLKGLGRLQHLTILGRYEHGEQQYEHLAANIAEAGLPARLQSLSYNFSLNDIFRDLLKNHAWPQLRYLSCGYCALNNLFEHLLVQPAAVFPQLETLDTSELYYYEAEKLLALLDRGAFPSLVWLRRPGHSLYMPHASTCLTMKKLTRRNT